MCTLLRIERNTKISSVLLLRFEIQMAVQDRIVKKPRSIKRTLYPASRLRPGKQALIPVGAFVARLRLAYVVGAPVTLKNTTIGRS